MQQTELSDCWTLWCIFYNMAGKVGMFRILKITGAWIYCKSLTQLCVQKLFCGYLYNLFVLVSQQKHTDSIKKIISEWS